MKKNITTLLPGLLIMCLFILTQCTKKQTSGNNKLKIGVILSLSGNGSASGDYTLKGIQLAVNEQNEKGGLLNQLIELDVQDSKGDAATGSTLIKQMVSNSEMPLMVCTNTSDVSLAVKTETEQHKILLVASAATDKLLENSNYIVRNYIGSEQISGEILKYITDSLHLKSLGLFYANNEFGNSISSKITGKADSYNIQLPFNMGYDDKNPDYTSLIAGVNIKQVPAIYVIGLGKSLGIFMKQLREAGYTGIIIADPLFNNPDTKTAAGPAATGVEFFDFAFNKDSGSPDVSSFVNDYTKTFNSSPQNLSAITYDALKMLFAAIQETKSLDNKKIITYTEEKKYNGVTGEIWVKEGNIIYPTIFKMH